MEQFTPIQRKDIKVLTEFIQIHCRSKHGKEAKAAFPVDLSGIVRNEVALCADCAGLLQYALQKRRRCPLDPKPACKNCHIHCYSKEYRARIREIMAFSGKRMILRGRLDYLWHYFF